MGAAVTSVFKGKSREGYGGHHCYPGLFVGMNEDHSRSSGMVLILCDSVNQGNHMSLYNLKL